MKNFRRGFALILALFLLLTAFPAAASAEVTGSLRSSCDKAASAAKAVAIYDMTDHMMLYVKNGTRTLGVGSITKVLTACVASQYFKADDTLTVGSEQNLLKSYASRAPVYSGQRYSFQNILAAMLVPSGCDAAYAIAANTARKASGNSNMSASSAISYFVSMMNSFCRKIGCTSSHFVNPDGQDISNQYTTVNDYIKVAEYAMNTPVIRNVVKNSYYSCYDKNGNRHGWATTNSMVNPNSSWYYKGAIGIKTGSTPNAGGCLLCAVDKNGKTIISLVVGTYYTESDYSQRFRTTHALLNVIEPFLEKRGDLNSDGKKDITDARIALRTAIGLQTLSDINRADLDLDGKVTVQDARTLLRVAIGFPEYQSPEEKAAEEKARQEAAKKAAEERARKKAEEEASRKAAEEASRKAAEEASRKAAEEASRKAAEEESRRIEAEKASRKAAEESSHSEAVSKAQEKAAGSFIKVVIKRLKAILAFTRIAGKNSEIASEKTAEASRKAAEESSRKAAEEASKKAAEESSRKAAEEASKKAAEESSRKAAEEASKKAAEEESSRKAAEESSRKAAEESSRKAEESTTSEETTVSPDGGTTAPAESEGTTAPTSEEPLAA